MGRRGTNQLRTIRVSVPADSIGYWADRLRAADIAVDETERFGTQRLDFAHPCGIPYSIVGETEQDDRKPWEGGDVPLEHAIRGAHGTTTSVREPGPMDDFLRRGMGAEHLGTEGAHHQYRIGVDGGGGRLIELVEEPDLEQGTWSFGEGTIHHHAFDTRTLEDQAAVKDWLVGLGYTDVSDVKDRGYFHSVYMRTPAARCSSSPPRRRRASPSTSRRTSSARTCASRRTGRTGAARSISWSRSTRSSRSSEPAPRSTARPGRQSARPGAAGRRRPPRPRPGAGLHARAPRRWASTIPTSPTSCRRRRAAPGTRGASTSRGSPTSRSSARRSRPPSRRSRRWSTPASRPSGSCSPASPRALPRRRPDRAGAAAVRGRGDPHRRADRPGRGGRAARAARRPARVHGDQPLRRVGAAGARGGDGAGAGGGGCARRAEVSDDREHRIRDAAVAGVRALLS